MSTNHKLALYVAYYLSRFNDAAYKELGYGTQKETHLRLGEILKTNPHTIKNMRDQFDPYHGHRAGWHQQPLSPSRAKVAEALQDLTEEEVKLIVSRIIHNRTELQNEGIENLITVVNTGADKQPSKTASLRGITGRQAEDFFLESFDKHQHPVPGKLFDCRSEGVGYDFLVRRNEEEYFIEIKGIAEFEGGILFTNKEWSTAQAKGDTYFLGIVSNLSNTPVIKFIRNPHRLLKAKMNILSVIQINWSVTVSQLKNLNG